MSLFRTLTLHPQGEDGADDVARRLNERLALAQAVDQLILEQREKAMSTGFTLEAHTSYAGPNNAEANLKEPEVLSKWYVPSLVEVGSVPPAALASRIAATSVAAAATTEIHPARMSMIERTLSQESGEISEGYEPDAVGPKRTKANMLPLGRPSRLQQSSTITQPATDTACPQLQLQSSGAVVNPPTNADAAQASRLAPATTTEAKLQWGTYDPREGGKANNPIEAVQTIVARNSWFNGYDFVRNEIALYDARLVIEDKVFVAVHEKRALARLAVATQAYEALFGIKWQEKQAPAASTTVPLSAPTAPKAQLAKVQAPASKKTKSSKASVKAQQLPHTHIAGSTSNVEFSESELELESYAISMNWPLPHFSFSNPMPYLWEVTVKISDMFFRAANMSQSTARSEAASKALSYFRSKDSRAAFDRGAGLARQPAPAVQNLRPGSAAGHPYGPAYQNQSYHNYPSTSMHADRYAPTSRFPPVPRNVGLPTSGYAPKRSSDSRLKENGPAKKIKTEPKDDGFSRTQGAPSEVNRVEHVDGRFGF